MLFFCFLDTLRGGGVERICLDHAKVLQSKGHEVLLVPRDGKVGMLIPAGCSILTEYNFRTDPSREIKKVLRLRQDRGCELVFMFHMRRCTDYLAKNIDFFTELGVECCAFIHSGLDSSYGIVRDPAWKLLRFKHLLEFWRIPRILTKSKDRLEQLETIGKKCKIFAVSDFIQNECSEYGIQNVSVLGNGIDIARIKELASQELAVCAEPYFVHVARFSSEKRQDMLLRAYARSKSQLKLMLVGDGACRSSLEKLAEQLDVREAVIFVGFVENPYPIIKSAKFSVICSEYEGFGLSIAESLCLSVPVLMTDRPYGVRTLLGSYDADFVCDDNEEALAARIRELSLSSQKRYAGNDFLNKVSLDSVVETFLSEINSKG